MFIREKYIADYETIKFEADSENPVFFFIKWAFQGLFDGVKYCLRFMLDVPPFLGLIIWITNIFIVIGTKLIICLFIFPTLLYVFYPVFFLVRLLNYKKMKERRISLNMAFGWVHIIGFYLGLPFAFFDYLKGETPQQQTHKKQEISQIAQQKEEEEKRQAVIKKLNEL